MMIVAILTDSTQSMQSAGGFGEGGTALGNVFVAALRLHSSRATAMVK
jgi:hypothetical protein